MKDGAPGVPRHLCRPLRLFLVDDNPRDRDLLAREVRNHFGTVVIASARDRAEFDQALRSQSFDAAVIDYQLGWSSGIQILRELKAARPMCPVIMFTASGSEAVAVEAMKEGLDDYVTKTAKHYARVPFALASCLERVRQRGELERASLEHLVLTEKVTASEQRLQLALEAAKMRAWEDDLSTGHCGIVQDATCTQVPFTAAVDGLGTVHAADLPGFRAAYKRATQTGESFCCEIRVNSAIAAASELWLEIRGKPLRDHDGQITRMIGVSADITERKRVEESLRAEQQRKDIFLATLAHELRNPLAPMRYATRLLEPGVPSNMAAEARRMIDRQLAHMARMLDDLLDVSRITRGVLEIRCEIMDLGRAIDEAAAAARPLAEAAGLRLNMVRPAVRLPVNGDNARLTQVIGNLLANAVKYTAAGGHIDIDGAIEGADAVVRVRDNGKGIAPEMLPRIFEAFVQGEPTGTRPAGGLGIGLSLARELLDLHSGRIDARSAGLGLGSEFCIRLPLADDRSAITEQLAASEKVVALGASEVGILIVDDNLDAANALSKYLAMTGYRTTVTHDGASAMALANRLRPNVVLLDLGLPDRSGIEVARHIRAQSWGADIHLIAITGWGREDDRERSRRAGFNHHLTKPVDPEMLLETLTDASLRLTDPYAQSSSPGGRRDPDAQGFGAVELL